MNIPNLDNLTYEFCNHLRTREVKCYTKFSLSVKTNMENLLFHSEFSIIGFQLQRAEQEKASIS